MESLINKLIIIKIIQFIIVLIFNFFLFSALIIGAFFVSAGAYIANNNKPIISNDKLNINGIFIDLAIIGHPINIIDDDNKHIQLFDACNPWASYLIK